MNQLPRMRTAAQAAAEFKSTDPGTGVTENFIRELIRSGKLCVVNAGRKQLINFDELLEVIASSAKPLPPARASDWRFPQGIAPINL